MSKCFACEKSEEIKLYKLEEFWICKECYQYHQDNIQDALNNTY